MGRQFFDRVFIVNETTDDYRSSLQLGKKNMFKFYFANI